MIIAKSNRFRLAKFIATGFGAGYLPLAPGTWGSIVALPSAALILWIGGAWLLFIFSLLAVITGLWASHYYAQAVGYDDPSEVVIDEVAGQWIALLFAPQGLLGFFAAFIFFRLFDIFKPWPASWFNNHLGGGPGIMFDDVIAGLYALFLCLLLEGIVGSLI